MSQLEVLFEDDYFHWRTSDALIQLRREGFLSDRVVEIPNSIRLVVLWRRNVRYVERSIQDHLALVEAYSSPSMSRASGDYAEILVDLGLTRLGLHQAARNTRSYQGRTWEKTEHDLDFIFEGAAQAYGVEVKNTFDYIPNEELEIKLDICKHLGLIPLFVVRQRHSRQWDTAVAAGGMLHMFKTKILPPSQNALATEMWQLARLPVAVWNDWRGQFYTNLRSFIQKTDHWGQRILNLNSYPFCDFTFYSQFLRRPLSLTLVY